MSSEIWRPALGFEGLYEVSNRGRVRSLKKRCVLNMHVGNKVGHLRVSMKPRNGPYCGKYVHQLVLEAFVGLRPEGLVACHNDGNPTNNVPENLRWDTHSSNMYDKVRHGTHHYAKRTHCPEGHLFDGAWLRPDGTVRQRYCKRCHSAYQSGRKKAGRTHCPKGHEFDAVRSHKGIEQRYCTKCVGDQLDKSRGKWWSDRTHCAKGHPFDGVRKNGGRSCSTCNRERSREGKARRKGFASHADKQAAAEAKVQERIEFGRQLSEAMTRVGVKQVVAAELFGTSQANVWRWMNGRCAPSPSHRAELMQLLEGAKA